MNQGSNMKQEVMEVLFDLPTNKLSQKHLKWILSNLPDDNSKGVFNTKAQQYVFDHEHDNVWEACGFTESDMDGCNKEMNHLVNMAKEAGNTKRSQIIETIINNASSKQLSVLLIFGIKEVVLDRLEDIDSEIPKKLDKLSGLISKLESSLGIKKEDEEDDQFKDLPAPLRKLFRDMLDQSKRKDDDTE